jgi:cell wall assembly regulator SMI1
LSNTVRLAYAHYHGHVDGHTSAKQLVHIYMVNNNKVPWSTFVVDDAHYDGHADGHTDDARQAGIAPNIAGLLRICLVEYCNIAR